LDDLYHGNVVNCLNHLHLDPDRPYQPLAFVVVDTNVFISHLHYLTRLVEMLREVSAQLVIPWIVSQELDDLKVIL
jgi:rRNA-processing protein FCF1